jgi:NADPH-dependent ferric siderophore reductase
MCLLFSVCKRGDFIMTDRKLRNVTVKRKFDLTPNMLRIILTGDDLKDFPVGQESAYIKLLFVSDSVKPIMRTYTIRKFDLASLELTVDFVVHGVSSDSTKPQAQIGPAISWANNVEVGEQITIDGPGPVKLIDSSADWVFLAGDMTAIPAISVNIEQLPEAAKGHVVLEILSAADKYSIEAPAGINIHWVINDAPNQKNSVLIEAVKNIQWFDGAPHIWVASEFDAMRGLRRYFKESFAEKDLTLNRGQIYASSYWKMGATDEGNKAAKKLDNEVV